MTIRHIDKRIGLVAVNENGKDKDYRLYAGQFSVHYATAARNSQGRTVRMHRTLNPDSAKAQKIREILAGAE